MTGRGVGRHPLEADEGNPDQIGPADGDLVGNQTVDAMTLLIATGKDLTDFERPPGAASQEHQKRSRLHEQAGRIGRDARQRYLIPVAATLAGAFRGAAEHLAICLDERLRYAEPDSNRRHEAYRCGLR